MTGDHTEWTGALDRLDLIHVILGNPDLPLCVEVDGRVFAVEDFRFAPGRGGVVLLLDPVAVRKAIWQGPARTQGCDHE